MESPPQRVPQTRAVWHSRSAGRGDVLRWHQCSWGSFFPTIPIARFCGKLEMLLPLPSGSRSSKTFKPKKNIPEGSHQYELLKHAEATLGSGNLRQAVMLPEGEDLNEWIAVNNPIWFEQLLPLALTFASVEVRERKKKF
ncbi:hypothetical protein Nmel_018572 [Mimus melanotis]